MWKRQTQAQSFNCQFFNLLGWLPSIKLKIKELLIRYSAPTYLTEIEENICPHQRLARECYSSFIHNSPKLETNLVSIKEGRDNQNMIHRNKRNLFINSKEQTTGRSKNLVKSQNHCTGQKHFDTNEYTQCDILT